MQETSIVVIRTPAQGGSQSFGARIWPQLRAIPSIKPGSKFQKKEKATN